MTMDAGTRRFVTRLLLGFGPLWVLGGFLAAFTFEGALFVYFGVGMFVSGLLLLVRLPVWLAVGAGVALFGVLVVQLVRDWPS